MWKDKKGLYDASQSLERELSTILVRAEYWSMAAQKLHCNTSQRDVVPAKMVKDDHHTIAMHRKDMMLTLPTSEPSNPQLQHLDCSITIHRNSLPRLLRQRLVQ
nr:hypothetical protein CFP56_77847 [Quercus suber]